MTYLRQTGCQMMSFESEKRRRLLITIGENSMSKKNDKKG